MEDTDLCLAWERAGGLLCRTLLISAAIALIAVCALVTALLQ